MSNVVKYTPVGSIQKTVADARAAFNSGKALSEDFRRAQLEALNKMIDENEAALMDACSKDLHKNPKETAVMELGMAKADIALTLNHLTEWMAPEFVSTKIINAMDKCQIRRDPLGVVLIIGAWNYPLQLTLVPLIGAIAAGNAAIIKPSEVSEHSAAILADLIPRYLDGSLYKVVNGAVQETTVLLKEKYDLIFYTGNGVVAKIIMRAAAEHLTPTILELGGKSPCVVDKNVDVRVAARRIAWGKFINCGQTCIAPDYVLCEKSVEAELVSEIGKALKEYYGDNIQESKDYGRIVTDRHFGRLSKLMQSGGKVAVGGQTDAKDKFIAPTVLVDVDRRADIMKEEVFGPILPIVSIRDIDDAIAYINQNDKPLALYVFSKDGPVCEKVLKSTTSGSALANDCLMQAAVHTLPFGGVGGSGMGAYHGKGTFDCFTHKRAVMVKDLGLEAINAIRYPPYTDGKAKWLGRIQHEPIYGKNYAARKLLNKAVFVGLLAFAVVKFFPGVLNYLPYVGK
jgi:aldehyde dehydrogenase (NAD+)